MALPPLPQEQLFSILQNANSTLVYYADTELHYRYANPSFEQVHHKQSVIGRHIKDVIGREGFMRNEVHYERVLAGEQVNYETHYGNVHGDELHYQVLHVPHIVNQRLEGFAGLEIDISASQPSTHDNSEVFRALAYNIRAPLTSSLAVLELEMRKNKQKMLQMQLQRLRDYIDDSLNYSKMYLRVAATEQTLEFGWKTSVLSSVINKALDVASPSATLKNVEINTDFAADAKEVFVPMHPLMMERMLVTLLDYCVSACPEEEGRLNVELARDGQWLNIVIRHNGTAIDELKSNLILNSSQRPNFNSITELEFHHAALTCKQHKGHIEVHNCAENGVCINIALPAAI